MLQMIQARKLWCQAAFDAPSCQIPASEAVHRQRDVPQMCSQSVTRAGRSAPHALPDKLHEGLMELDSRAAHRVAEMVHKKMWWKARAPANEA